MTVASGAALTVLVVALAVGMFNGLVLAVSAYFGPFYESDAEQSRNFGLWLVGNGLVVSAALAARVVWYCRLLGQRRE